MRYFLIRQNDGLIIGSIIWDGISPWTPPNGCFVLPESNNPNATTGWRKLENSWEAPPSPSHYWNGTEWIDRSNDGIN